MVNKVIATKILYLILFLGFIVRLYGFTNPIADWHSWRQADTSAVSRNFIESGFDLLHPRFDDLSNVPSGLDNPNGYRFVEFPLYNLLQAGLFEIIDIFTLEEWGRLITIFASLSGAVFLYKIVSQYSGFTAGLGSAFFYTFLPYNIYYGRVILPDPLMVATILGGIYFFDRWLRDAKRSWGLFAFSLMFTATSVLLKPYALFYGLIFLSLSYVRFGLKFLKEWKVWLFGILSVLPFIAWRIWMQQFPEGIPSNTWLFNGNGIRFRPAFFRWMGYERLTKLISGYIGIFILFFGVYQLRFEKEKLVYGSFIVSALLYITVFATGNVQHDYYQIAIMPTVALLFGLGTKFFLEGKNTHAFSARTMIFTSLTIGVLTLSWFQVKDFFNINNRAILIAGKTVDELLPKNAKVIANYNGDTTFLYQTKRKGWASFEKPLPQMVKMGADYLVLVNPTKADEEIGQKYKIVKQTKDFIIFDLHQSL